ncbi:hypothetical protein AQBE111736_13245 [Aquirufa beregesia]
MYEKIGDKKWLINELFDSFCFRSKHTLPKVSHLGFSSSTLVTNRVVKALSLTHKVDKWMKLG